MKFNLIWVAGLSLVLLGCGGGGALTAASGSVNQAQAVVVFNTPGIVQALGTLVPNGSAQAPINLPAGFVDADPYDSCTTVNPNSPVDLDGDGIKAYREVKFACSNIPFESGAGSSSRHGTYKIVDYNDEPGSANMGWGGGFRYDFDFSNSYRASHEEFTDIYNGFFEVKSHGNTLAYSSGFTGTVKGKALTPTQFDWDWKWRSQWENTYTPEDPSQPYAKGTAKFGGFFGVRGTMQPDIGSGEQAKIEVVFALKSKNLKYDRACSHYWQEGSIIYLDGSNNEIRYDYACSSVDVFFNGKKETSQFLH